MPGSHKLRSPIGARCRLLVTGVYHISSAVDLGSEVASYRDLAATRSDLQEKRVSNVDPTFPSLSCRFYRQVLRAVVVGRPACDWDRLKSRWRPFMPMSGVSCQVRDPAVIAGEAAEGGRQQPHGCSTRIPVARGLT